VYIFILVNDVFSPFQKKGTVEELNDLAGRRSNYESDYIKSIEDNYMAI
jgi:hypothetical protein